MKKYGVRLFTIAFLLSIGEIAVFLNLPLRSQILALAISLITAGFGWTIFRKHGWNDLFYLDAELKKNGKIVKELWLECLVLIASLLLLFPGLLSDVAGAALLFEPVRLWILDRLLSEKTL